MYDFLSQVERTGQNREKSPLSPLSKLIKRIWYVSLAVGATEIMLQDKFALKEMFWIISTSTLFLVLVQKLHLFERCIYM